ncbi:phosphoenolpyruvate synthase [bacterium SCGC AG-212-C10]|nr:phosphoenolpyruvate synthase [bacterium SCGC AG-212-C10]
MISTTRSVVWFSEVGREDLGLVGGKGANLGELTRAEIPVPPGFVVTADTYFHFIRQNGLEPVIKKELFGLDVQDSRQLNDRAARIRQRIIEAPMPAHIAAEIREAYRELGEGAVAVRSSATAEDLPEASFAGQQSTFLNVQGADNVVLAVQACWASLFEGRAIFYREEAGYDHVKVGLAVPVQRMVQSQKSGVMFTVEPVTSDASKITIEAVYGLGEGIVSGEISPDLYFVDKESLRIIEKTTTPQERMIARTAGSDGAYEGANSWQDVPADLVGKAKLTDAEIRELARIGRGVEEHYGAHQDIEWAYEDGKFYLTQARPVTTMREQGAEDTAEETAAILLTGQSASPGVGFGGVRICLDPNEIDIVKKGDILVAEMTTPDFVPAMKRAAAIITERGGRTCHAAIVSRELGIPCVVGVSGATKALKDGQEVTVDGSKGNIHEGRAEARLAWAEIEKNRYANAAKLKTTTKLYVNLAEPELADRVAERHVDGIGLLRAEFIVAQIGVHPRTFIAEGRGADYTAQLAEGISKFCSSFAPRPVVYRLTDFKTNEYANLRGGAEFEPSEENPMIGFRGASRYVKEPEVFKLEMDAILKVRESYKNLYVMVPFVRTPAELKGVKQLLAERGLVRGDDFKLWMMVEVPSNVIILDKFIDVGLDGISIGSNDLTQLVLGCDRDSEMLADTFDERDEAVMSAIQTAVTVARRRGITAGICGQAPSVYPEITEKLVEWGISSVSVSPDMIDQTREIIANAEAKLGRAPK